MTYSPSNIADEGIRVLRSSNIDEELYVISDDDVFVKKECVNIPYCKNGDILITAANGSSKLVGKHAILKGLLEKNTVHGGFMILGESDNPYFINASMSSSWYEKFINLNVAGGNGAIGNLNKNDLENQSVLFPKNDEQEILGKLFDNIDTLITLHQLNNKLYLKLIFIIKHNTLLHRKEMIYMIFATEKEFEDKLVEKLITNGWKDEILINKSEKDLILNWKRIIENNNNGIDRLNDCPLTDSEMDQILSKVKSLKSPFECNKFIIEKDISIKRDNKNDTLHYGKEIGLNIFNRNDILNNGSKYQIARQVNFDSRSGDNRDRRGDVTLLINGMPLIHIELKRGGSLTEPFEQIRRYARENIFTGFFSLVQVFVVMTPEECKYFANPGDYTNYNPKFMFNWTDKYNIKINVWDQIVESFLKIPNIHELIGYFTVADEGDHALKVMRPYQIHAVEAIFKRVLNYKWDDDSPYKGRGGYIWHTTGSGKTMTSFKAAQLLTKSSAFYPGCVKIDSVLFVVDRVELSTQSYNEYNNFADTGENVQKTYSGSDLINKIIKKEPLIITSIQKLSAIDANDPKNAKIIEQINSKKIILIFDECHRSTFGDMMGKIKINFPNMLRFGFTGTPIMDENKIVNNTTVDVFGNKLHEYRISNGISDGNVLGFDIIRSGMSDRNVRNAVIKFVIGKEITDILPNTPEWEKMIEFQNKPMSGYYDETGKYQRGIEDYLSNSHFRTEEYTINVVKDIINDWPNKSLNGTFHAIFATSSIKEAIHYYHLFKEINSVLKVYPLYSVNKNDYDAGFDEFGNYEDNQNVYNYDEDKELNSIIEDYNKTYNTNINPFNDQLYKKDLSNRLAHKYPYNKVKKEEQVDIVIVVNQLLTGFDSKWVNTLYVDKMLQYQNIIQAFSRTNRVLNENKRHGIIVYYRRPNTMKNYIDKAIKLYSETTSGNIYVPKLRENVLKINELFKEIKEIFTNVGILDFSKLPSENSAKSAFANHFKNLNFTIKSAKVQDFNFQKEIKCYLYDTFDKSSDVEIITCDLDEEIYNILIQRYKELIDNTIQKNDDVVLFDIDSTIIESETYHIDKKYMNDILINYQNEIIKNKNSIRIKELKDAIMRKIASLSEKEQIYAKMVLDDIDNNRINISNDKNWYDYLKEYMEEARKKEIYNFANETGFNFELLYAYIESKPDLSASKDEHLEAIINSFDPNLIKEYIKKHNIKVQIPLPKIAARIILNDFLIKTLK